MASATRIIRRRHLRQQRRAEQDFRNRLWTYFILGIFGLLVVLPLSLFFGTAAVVYAQEAATLPRPGSTLDFSAVAGPTRLYDRTGRTLIYAVQDPLGDKRTWLRLDELPPYVLQATLLVEDEDFYTGTSFDAMRTVTRLWRNFLNGPIEPESSITGRLVRNAIAPPPEFVRVEDRTREIALIAEVNRLYSLDEILEWHLNTNYYGNEAYGIEAAAQVYLGKAARDLTLDEAALLTSIPTAPQFNPIDDEIAARGRQSDTLRRLLSGGFITEAQYDDASRTTTVLLPNAGQKPDMAPDFALYARQQAENILDTLGLDGERLVSRGGLRITTTLDVDLYNQSECVLQSHLAQLAGSQANFNAPDGSPCTGTAYLGATPVAGAAPPDSGMIVMLDVATGELRSMVGGAHRAAYQPGVTLYPFVYFEGFRGSRTQNTYFTPASMVLDIPRMFPGQADGLFYQPTNPDGQFRGPISLREAVGRSLLPPAVHVANTQGLSNVLRSAHTLGINSLTNGVYHLSLLERGGEVALLDVAYAYSVLSSMGEMRGVPVEPRGSGLRQLDPAAVLKIEDADNNVLWSYDTAITRQNIFTDSSELGYLVNDVFADESIRTAQFGENNALNLNRPAAVVNGLTIDRVDDWTVGYTPQWIVGVHLGRTDAAPMSLTDYGLTGAAPVWKALSEYVHIRDNILPTEWQRPLKVIETEVCQRSGLLPSEVCPRYRELFLQGVGPTQVDTYWQRVKINTQTGQRATVNTPLALQEDELFFVPPAEALDWWKANRLRLPPEQSDVIYRAPDDLFGTTAITSPALFAYVKGPIEIRGNVNADNLQSYQLSYGRDVNPTAWTSIGEPQTTFVPGSILGTWDTTGLDGLYTLQLTAVLQNGIREPATVQVRVDNTPPTIIISTTEPGKIYRFPEDRIVTVQAEVRDNFEIDRVEFYHDSVLVATDDTFPYSYDYGIAGTGIEYFRAEAFDAAGNQSSSQEITVEIRR